MAQKRASDEPELGAKRAATKPYILASIDAYRLVLASAGQSLAAQLLGDNQLDVADKWLQDASPATIAIAVLTLCADYAQHKDIVCTLMASMPAVWTIPVDGVPFVIRLYNFEVATSSALESLFLTIPDASVATCRHPDTGDTILHYATEHMHVAVVNHLLCTLHCNVIPNKTGHHALFAPLLMATVEADPMDRIIRAFHRARQHDLMLFDPNQIVHDTTILGLLEKFPYPELIRTWLQSYSCDGATSSSRNIYSDDKIAPNIAVIVAQFRNKNGYAILSDSIEANDMETATKLVQNGLQIKPCNKEHHPSLITIACRFNFTQIIPLLISYGTNPSEGCQCGKTGLPPLAFAVLNDRPDLYQFLLDNGASLYARTDIIEPIIMMIRQPSFHQRLIKQMPTIDLQRSWAIMHCPARPAMRCSLLSLCVETGNAELVSAVIANGGKDLAVDESFHVAIEREDLAMVELLLRTGTPQTLECVQKAARATNPGIFPAIIKALESNLDLARAVLLTSQPLPVCRYCHKSSYTFDWKAIIDYTISTWATP